MFVKILLSLLLFSSTTFAQADAISPSNIRTYKQFKNYIINPDAEKNITTGITNTSSIVTRDTSTNRLNGSASFAIDGTASGQKVKFKMNTLPNKFGPGNGEFSFQYRATFSNATGDYKYYVENNTGTKKSAEYSLLTSSASPSSLTGTFVGDSTLDNPYYLVFESIVAAPDVFYVDDVYCGDVTSIGQFSAISESIDAGTMTIGAVTTGPTKGAITTDKVTYVREGKYAVINYTLNQAAGVAGSGDYLFSLPSGLAIDTAISPAYATAGQIAIAPAALASRLHASGRLNNTSTVTQELQAFTYSATQFRLSINFSSAVPNMSNASGFNLGIAFGMNFTVRVPIQGWSASQSAAAANQTDYGWTAYTPTISAGFGASTNISFLHMRKGENLIVKGTFTAGAVAASLGSITLPNSLVLDTTKISINNTTANPGSIAGRWDISEAATGTHGSLVTAPATSASLIYFGGSERIAASSLTPQNISGGVAASSVVIAVEFTVPISGWSENQRAPTLIGSVTSNSVSALAIETVRFSGGTWATNVCAASPCTINSSSNSGITVTRASTGVYTLNFPAGLFSAAPSCTFTVGNNANPTVVSFIAGTYSATAHPFKVDSGSGGVLDVWGNIICMGPR